MILNQISNLKQKLYIFLGNNIKNTNPPILFFTNPYRNSTLIQHIILVGINNFITIK